jgi:3-oxoacid CoA-transferase B subunit
MARDHIEELIAWRVAQDIPAGAVVNCGVGIPIWVVKHIPPERGVIFQSENGVIGFGPPPPAGEERPLLTNAGVRPVTLEPGGVFTDSLLAFAIMRSRLDIGILGTMEVDHEGSLANWMIPGRWSPGIGGAMDLAFARKVFVCTEHRTSSGRPKLVERCTLPLTALRRVHRVYTEMAVIDITPRGFLMREIARGYTVEEVRRATGAPLEVAKDLRTLDLPEDLKPLGGRP